MKKLIAMLLALVMLLALCACGQTAAPAEQSTTPRKLRNTRIAVSAGKMTRLEIKSAPIIRIPTTTVTAVSIASRVL